MSEPSGDAPAVLEVEMEWRPSGVRLHRSLRTADGLCVLHWRSKEDGVSIVARSAHGYGELAVEGCKNGGRVIELRLTPAAPLADVSRRPVGSSSSL